MKAGAALEIEDICGQPGQLVYGALEAVALPSGTSDNFPIIIAQGKYDGPVLWLTASIHGAEYTGILVIHHLLTDALVRRLRGTIVAVPTLNPAGLRTADRSAYYLRGQDPNRLFPGSSTRRLRTSLETPFLPLEIAYQRLFDHIVRTANYLIDLHNYALGSIPFALRDPVYYRGVRDRPAAQQRQTLVGEMLTAFGHTVVNEFASAEYLKKNLHRSVSGAALNTAHIPAFTAELGGYMSVEPTYVAAAVGGIRNVLRWADMLDGEMEPITGVRQLSPGYAMRRAQHPFAPASGIVSYLVRAGDPVKSGEPVARLADIYGRPVGENDGLICSELDGIVLGVSQGAVCYQGDPLLSLAIRDDSDLVVPFPA
jgi:predicted deacylase